MKPAGDRREPLPNPINPISDVLVPMSAPATTETKPPAPPAPPIETIKVKVDGREVDVPKMTPDWQGKPQATTMLQACALAGVDVPHYCYHHKLPVAGNCRMCLIEIGTPVIDPATKKPALNEDGTPKIARSVLPYEPGTPRGAIACATPISPGMELYPGSAATAQMREAVLESLLINHPLDCPICDQAGECKLQEYSVQHGQAASRFVEAKVHKPKAVDLGPRIVLDDERCILCTRCIRFTKDIAGDDALGIINRGSYNTIAAFPGRQFDNNYTLNTVDICPVGALTSKDFRFKMRVWFLKETKSICPGCATGCNIVIGSREDVIHRLEPRENAAVNSCWMCDAGRLDYKWVAHPDRLKEVLIGGRKSTWAAAFRELSTRLDRAGTGTVAVIGSSRLSTEELYLLKQLAAKWGALTDVVEHAGEGDRLLVHADKSPNTQGARITGMSFTEVGIQLPKIREAIASGQIKSVVVFGEDLVAAGFDAGLLRKLDLLVVSDILPTATTALAHVLLPGCAYAEKRGTFINAKGRLQKFMKAVEPKGDARPEWEILHEWIYQLTDRNGYSTIEGLFNQMARELSPLAGLDWAKIGDAGVRLPI